MAHDTDPALLVDRALTPAERALFLERVYNNQPRMVGAEVADVLDIWDNADYALGLTEPFWERHAAELDGIRGMRCAVYAALVLDDGSLKIETVRNLARRAGLVPMEG